MNLNLNKDGDDDDHSKLECNLESICQSQVKCQESQVLPVR